MTIINCIEPMQLPWSNKDGATYVKDKRTPGKTILASAVPRKPVLVVLQVLSLLPIFIMMFLVMANSIFKYEPFRTSCEICLRNNGGPCEETYLTLWPSLGLLLAAVVGVAWKGYYLRWIFAGLLLHSILTLWAIFAPVLEVAE